MLVDPSHAHYFHYSATITRQQLAEPLWTGPGLRGVISVRYLISTLKKKKKSAGGERIVEHSPKILARGQKSRHALSAWYACHQLLGLLLSKDGRGQFNVRNDCSACFAYKGETGTDEAAQVMTRKNRKTVRHPVMWEPWYLDLPDLQSSIPTGFTVQRSYRIYRIYRPAFLPDLPDL